MATERGGLEYTLKIRDQGLATLRNFNSEIVALRGNLNRLKRIRSSGLANLAQQARQATGEISRLSLARRLLNRQAQRPLFNQTDLADIRRLIRQTLILARRVRQVANAQQQFNNNQRQAVNRQRQLNSQVRRTNALLSPLRTSVGQFARLGAVVLAFEAIGVAAEGIRGFVGGIVEFNRQLEKSELGIAAIISSLSEVRNLSGDIVTGAQALSAAQGIAADQVRRLRVDAQQTAATFTQLTEAFQTAVGPGLEAGLNIDEIREFTVRISQAAAALGLEQFQLPEEIRSILRGTISPRTTRIATALQIDNEDIRRARELGNLATFLQERFVQFGVAGTEALETFDAVLTNTFDALQQALGEGGIEFFRELKNLLDDIRESLVTVNVEKGIRVRPEVVDAVSILAEGFSTAFDEARRLAGLFSGDLRGSARTLSDLIRRVIQFTSGFIEGLVNVAGVLSELFTGFADTLESLGLELSDVGAFFAEFLAVVTLLVGPLGTALRLLRSFVGTGGRLAGVTRAIGTARAALGTGAGAGIASAAVSGTIAAGISRAAPVATVASVGFAAARIGGALSATRDQLSELQGQTASWVDTLRLAGARALQSNLVLLGQTASFGRQIEKSILAQAALQGDLNRRLFEARELTKVRAEVAQRQAEQLGALQFTLTQPTVTVEDQAKAANTARKFADVAADLANRQVRDEEAVNKAYIRREQVLRSLRNEAERTRDAGFPADPEVEVRAVERLIRGLEAQAKAEAQLAEARASRDIKLINDAQTQLNNFNQGIQDIFIEVAEGVDVTAAQRVLRFATLFRAATEEVARARAQRSRTAAEQVQLFTETSRLLQQQRDQELLGIRAGASERRASITSIDEQRKAQARVNELIFRGESRGLAFRRAQANLDKANAVVRLSAIENENKARQAAADREVKRLQGELELIRTNAEQTEAQRDAAAQKRLAIEREIADTQQAAAEANAKALADEQQQLQTISDSLRVLEPTRGERFVQFLSEGLETVGETIVGGLGTAIDAVGGFFSDLFGLGGDEEPSPQLSVRAVPSAADPLAVPEPAPERQLSPAEQAAVDSAEAQEQERDLAQQSDIKLQGILDAVQQGVALQTQQLNRLAALRASIEKLAAAAASGSGRTGTFSSGPQRQAEGGIVHNGPKAPNSVGVDTQAILAQPGEFMQRLSAVRTYGRPFMEALNAGLIDPTATQALMGLGGYRGRITRMRPGRRGFQTGGQVGSTAAAARDVRAILVNDEEFATAIMESPAFVRGIYNNQETIRSVL